GALVTRAFTLENNRILMNAAAHTGEIVAELVEPYHTRTGGDPAGKPIEGYTAADFDVFRGDALAHELSWRGSSDLSPLRGRRLMLRMSLTMAQIYSLTL